MLLCDGYFDTYSAKTATGLILWCPDEIVAVIDAGTAGKTVGDVLGCAGSIPIVRAVAEAVKLGGKELVIGVANIGGVMVPGYAEKLIEAMKLGCDVTAGLHDILAEDPELAAIAAENGVKISDVRLVPPVSVGWNRARAVANRRVLSVGSDCNVGKMCTALALTREFTSRGEDAKFVATGQTGILIEGDGLCIDRAISDFSSGIAEKLVMDNADRDWLFIEGQGSIDHPSYSGVTLSLIHGTAPQAFIFCHVASRDGRRHDDGTPLLPLAESIMLNEIMSKPILPAKVVGVTLKTNDLDEESARREIEKTEDELGLPVTDPIRYGVSKIADALIEFFTANPCRSRQ